MLPPRSSTVDAFHDIIPWRRSQIEGLDVTLIDPDYYQHLFFGEDGSLAMTAGSGGKLCGPLFGWRLRHGRLFTCDLMDGRFNDELYLVSLTDDLLTMRHSNGKLSRYKVHRDRQL
jgi:hypothetical protein